MKKFCPQVFTVILLIASAKAFPQPNGTVEFSATTIDNHATFSPKHVLAIWIEDESGSFVKSLEVMADKRIQYLYTWNDVSKGDKTDALTGATLPEHRTENVTWDCTDTEENPVPDGNYRVLIEYTSAHEQGPLASFTFGKSDSAVSLQPDDETYFQDISLSYTPASTGIDRQYAIMKNDVKIYPNPFSEMLRIDYQSQTVQHLRVAIYNNRMQLLKIVFEGAANAGLNSYNWTASGSTMPPAVYYVVISNGHSVYARSVIKTR
jgi:hypothetical protein